MRLKMWSGSGCDGAGVSWGAVSFTLKAPGPRGEVLVGEHQDWVCVLDSRGPGGGWVVGAETRSATQDRNREVALGLFP